MTILHDPNAGMGQLIPIIERGGDYWVDARLLHVALGSGSRFNDWVTRRLADTLATEGEDFYSELSKTTPGRPSTEYFLGVDLAKEFAMLERSDRGKAIRRYFIQAEKALREGGELPTPPAQVLPTDPVELLALSLEGLQQHRRQLAVIEQRLDNAPIRVDSALRARVHAACQAFGRVHPRSFAGAYRAFKEAFGFSGAPLAAYDDLPQSRAEEALAWLEVQVRTFAAQRPLLGGEA